MSNSEVKQNEPLTLHDKVAARKLVSFGHFNTGKRE
jgi:hypothetical protein